MRRLVISALVFAFSLCLHAQVVDTTVCDVLKNPASFDGKIVRVKGTVAAGFNQFAILGSDCGQRLSAIWLAYPEGVKAKAGAVAVINVQPAHNFAGTVAATQRTPVILEKSKDFKQFDSFLSAPYKGGGICLGCVRYTVNATLVGRLDGVQAGIKRDGKGKIVSVIGFGHLNAYSARLVLQSVSDVTSQEIDYSKTAALTKGDTPQENADKDPIATAHASAKLFGDGNHAGAQVERAVAAFGKPNETNGVAIGFGPSNEVSLSHEAQGATDSPDGVLFNCTFDSGRLKGSALSIALTYLGSEISDIRNPPSPTERVNVFDLEYNAGGTAALTAVASHLKTLVMPGDYLFWNAAWETNVRDTTLDNSLTGYIRQQELLKP